MYNEMTNEEEAARLHGVRIVIDNTLELWESVELDAYDWLHLNEAQKMARVFDFMTLHAAAIRRSFDPCWFMPSEAEIIEAYYDAVDEHARDNA